MQGRIILLVLIMIFLWNEEIDGQRPSWFDHVAVLNTIKGLPTTGAAWAAIQGWDLNYYHSRDKFYYGNMSFEWDIYPNVSVVDSSLACLDIEGRPILAPNGQNGSYQPNLHNPAWQDSLRKWVVGAIDLGLDGIHVDGFAPNVLSIIEKPGGSFDRFTMDDFSTYLQANYSSEELATKFGITDISTFDFRDWVIDNNLQESWNNWPLVGLPKEFQLFEFKYAKRTFAEFSAYAKDYSQTVYGRPFVVTQNGTAYYITLGDVDDFYMGEAFYFGTKFRQYAGSTIKVINSIHNKPAVLLTELGAQSGIYNIPFHTTNLIKYILADIYSARGTAVTYQWYPEENVGTLGSPPYTQHYSYDLEGPSHYFSYILNHNELHEDMESYSNIGLVYSNTTSYYNNWWHNNIAYDGIANMLIEANIQFDAIYMNDNRFGPSQVLPQEKLNDYEVIILPNVHSMTENHILKLLSYLQSGGTIIACGRTGLFDEYGEPTNRPVLEVLTHEGTHQYLDGTFVYTPEDLGERYTWGEDENAKVWLINEIGKYVQPQTKIDSAEHVSVYAYQKDSTSTKVFHLVNHDFDPNLDQFTEKEAFSLQILADTSKNWEAIYSSPDFHDIKSLPVSYDQEYVSISIPQLEVYGILVLQENNYHPQLISYTPGDTTIVAGEELQLSIEAKDPEANPLYYHWYIDGQIDSTATGTTYHFQTSRSHIEETINIRVIITDGSKSITKDWFVGIKEYTYPRLLFDESHNTRNTISLERAREINDAHPEWSYFGILQAKVDLGYFTDRHINGALTPGLLENYDALILPAPDSRYTAAEVNTIENFVQEGGGLLFLGDVGLNDEINMLLNRFGFHFENVVIFEPYLPGNDGGNTKITHFEPHPSIPPRPAFDTNWGGSFTTSNNSIPLAFTNNNTWRDLNWNKLQDENEAVGPFTIIGAGEYGKGRVFCIADNALHDDFLQWGTSQNDAVYLQGLKWITERVNREVTSTNLDDESTEESQLFQNYPNPFRDHTTFSFQITKPTHVSLVIVDMYGQSVKTLINQKISPGLHSIDWDGTQTSGQGAPNGIYFYQFKTPAFQLTKKCILAN